MSQDDASEDAQRAGDELSASITGLSSLLTGSQSLEDTLVQVAEYAVTAIPGATGAGLTLLETDRAQTVVATADFVRAIDDIQYGLNEGPCVSAVRLGRTVTSGNLGGESQWPHFGPRVGRLGVHSALSLPLLIPGRTVGAMNIYAPGHNVFTSDAIARGEAFATPAAVTVANALVLAKAERLVTQLKTALVSRAEIDQAMGIVMSRTGATSEQAFAQLRSLSQSGDVRLADVAKSLVADAVRRARARRRDTGESGH